MAYCNSIVWLLYFLSFLRERCIILHDFQCINFNRRFMHKLPAFMTEHKCFRAHLYPYITTHFIHRNCFKYSNTCFTERKKCSQLFRSKWLYFFFESNWLVIEGQFANKKLIWLKYSPITRIPGLNFSSACDSTF